MDAPILYRKRLIPNQLIRLDEDHIVYMDEDMIITTWTTINPKPNLTHGISCYFLKEGIKVSKFYNHDYFKFWYCDIIETAYDEATNCYTFTDLLIDIIIRPDGFVKVVDLDELSEALGQSTITSTQLQYALKTTDGLLRSIYKGEFHKKIIKLEEFDQ